MVMTKNRTTLGGVAAVSLLCLGLLVHLSGVFESGSHAFAQPPDGGQDDCEAIASLVVGLQEEINEKEAERESLERVQEQLAADVKKAARRMRRHIGITADGDDIPIPPEVLADFRLALGAAAMGQSMLRDLDAEISDLKDLRDYWLDMYLLQCG